MSDENNFPTLGPIIVGTSDMKRCKEFYVNVFGINIETEEEHYINAYGVDGTQIELEMDTEHRFPNWANHNIGTYKNSEFVVSDMDLFLKTVEKYGGRIVSKPLVRPWGSIAAEFADPDGNIFLMSQKAKK